MTTQDARTTRRMTSFAVICLVLFSGGEGRSQALDEIVVTSERRAAVLRNTIGNVALLDEAAIADEAHAHIHELLLKTPGAWISRGSGRRARSR